MNRLHLFVVLPSFMLTLAAWWLSAHALEQRNTQRFGRQADKVIGQLVEQLQRHADILAAGAGLVTASDDVTRDEWQRFTATLDLENKFPALNAIGVAYRVLASELPDFLARQRKIRPDYSLHPAHERSEQLAVVHITPERLAPAVEGLDMLYERNRREAVGRAAELGQAQITAPVLLSISNLPGVVMMVPFYRKGPKVPPGERAERFAGTVVASMLPKNLAAGTLDMTVRQIRMRISDGDALLYDELSAGSDDDIDPVPLNTLVRRVPVYGRRWRIEVHSTLGFRQDANQMQPLLVLAGGLSIDFLLFALLWQHARAERQLRRAATDLHERSTALALTNEKLEAFACVASHDLKTPLSGICSLVEFIEEDLGDYCARENVAPDSLPDISHNLKRVRQQAKNANALIEGILDYSGLDNKAEPVEPVDTRILLAEIAETLDLGPDNLTLLGTFPVFETNATRLRQVFVNLIGNAFKYHPDALSAEVRVSVESTGAFYRFSVSDDGPGIAARYHEQIFEPFGKGHTDARSDSTGVGLAIVSKSVEAMGGTIRVDSAPGSGATFVFDWPSSVSGSDTGSPTPGAGCHEARQGCSAVRQRAA